MTPEAVLEEKEQMRALKKREADLKRDCWVQAGYAPLTMHWYAPLLSRLDEDQQD